MRKLTDERVASVLDLLRKRGETVTTVESLTAGMISARLADIPGSSDVLKRAYVTYCDEAKHEMAGVSRDTLRRYTAVSAQTAAEMAAGGAGAADAQACVSATGYAGPACGPEDDTVGTVFLGCFYRGTVVTQEHHYTGERNEVRRQAMEDAILLLENCIRETPVCSE
jgi:PncC family amidohydrolase